MSVDPVPPSPDALVDLRVVVNDRRGPGIDVPSGATARRAAPSRAAPVARENAVSAHPTLDPLVPRARGRGVRRCGVVSNTLSARNAPVAPYPRARDATRVRAPAARRVS